MTPSIAGPDAAGDPPPIRLGPSAAWRCRRRLHLDVVSQLDPAHDGAPPDDRQPDGQPQGHGQLTDGGRSALPDAAQRARDELTRHRDLVFRLIRMARPAAAADAQRSSSVGPWWTDPQAVVLAPDMTTGGRSGAADLLVWWGDGYVPVLIRAHRTRDAGAGGLSSSLAEPVLIRVDPSRRTRRNRVDRLVLAHHFRQLTELGCASRTAFGGVIGRGGPGAETEPGGPGPGGPGPGGPGGPGPGGPGPGPGGDVHGGDVHGGDVHGGEVHGADDPGGDHHAAADHRDGADGGRGAEPGRDLGGGDSQVIVWHDLDAAGASVLRDYDRLFADRLAVATAAATGGPPLAFPSRIGECRRCPWWPRCSAELRATGDISLLLSGGDVAAARSAGVQTVRELADLPPAAVAGLPFTVAAAGLSQVRARARLGGFPLVRVGPRASIRRAAVELDVDAESYGEDGAYLWGAALSGADVGIPGGYRAFVTWERLPSPTQGEVFGGFFDHLIRVRDAAAARGLSLAVYCYGKSAEERWMLDLARRYGGRPGVPDADQVAAFCASPHWVDLLTEVKRQFVPPGSLRLKDLASSIGFAWRDPEPGGENSMVWYRAAVGGGSSQAAAQMAQRVVRYNEDDVLATLAVRNWIDQHLQELPTVAELEQWPPPR